MEMTSPSNDHRVDESWNTAEHTPLISNRRPLAAQLSVYLFVIVPFLSLIAAVTLTWGESLTWLNIILSTIWYTMTMLGATVGYHRYFTHRSFKATRSVRIALAILGSMAVQGPILHWVADHRRHHAFADRDGDPHSPWLYGTTPAAIVRGIWHAHLGWILNRDLTNQRRFAPDLLDDRDIRLINRLFGPIVIINMLLPPVLGGIVTWSWSGAISAFYWVSLIRLGVQHHVTWSVNSICHMIGQRPFAARDRSTNFWPLAILSMGDSWHNLHHAHPTCARHGVERGQIDISARVIWLLEKTGGVYDVRWPKQEKIAHLRSTQDPMPNISGTRDTRR